MSTRCGAFSKAWRKYIDNKSAHSQLQLQWPKKVYVHLQFSVMIKCQTKWDLQIHLQDFFFFSDPISIFVQLLSTNWWHSDW